jgi:hypothetical protein
VSGRRGIAVLVAVLVTAVGLGLLLRTQVDPVPPFDIDSSQPDGLRAVRLLLEQQGVRVEGAPASSLLDPQQPGVSDEPAAVVMMAPSVAAPDELEALLALADRGTLVVLGEPLPEDTADEAFDTMELTALEEAQLLTGRILADTPAMPVEPEPCDIDELADLGPLDTAFAFPMPIEEGRQACFAEPDGTYIAREPRGSGAVVTLAAPFLWVNARLQPQKEEGGEPLANGATAVRLLGQASEVTFLDPVPSPGATPTGQRSPLDLLPLPVELALAQLLGAFAIFIWWRSRRLGQPVAEALPVEIAGSELVGAVGDLLRRRGNVGRAAATLRADTRRVLCERLGLGPDPAPVALVEIVAARTGRDAAAVGAALYDDPAAPVTDGDALAQLSITLDAIRQEVLHVDAR